ncbi:MAG: hypothetical protein ACK52I_05000 [Pseudomonadota bacterium]
MGTFKLLLFLSMVREKEIPTTKTVPKPVYIRLQLAAGEAISAPPLSAILGQAQINSSEFCKVFNAYSLQLFEQGVLLNIDLFKNPDNTYYFYIRGISLPYLFFQVANDGKYIPVEKLYDVFTLKAITISIPLNFSSAKLFFGALRGMNFKILL